MKLGKDDLADINGGAVRPEEIGKRYYIPSLKTGEGGGLLDYVEVTATGFKILWSSSGAMMSAGEIFYTYEDFLNRVFVRI